MNMLNVKYASFVVSLLLTTSVYAEREFGATTYGCINMPVAATSAFTVNFNPQEVACMNESGGNQILKVSAGDSGVKCVEIGYVEACNTPMHDGPGHDCKKNPGLWNLNYSTGSYTGAAQTAWNKSTKVSLQNASTTSTQLCLSPVLCGQQEQNWSKDSTQNLYVIFQPSVSPAN